MTRLYVIAWVGPNGSIRGFYRTTQPLVTLYEAYAQRFSTAIEAQEQCAALKAKSSNSSTYPVVLEAEERDHMA